MTSRDFVYWLQGFFEISKDSPNYTGELNERQVQMIEKHLSLVFVHEIDPSYGDKKHTDKLNKIHENKYPSGIEKDYYNDDPIIRC